MFSFLYDCALFFYLLVTLPRLLWKMWTTGKYTHTLKQRFGFALPKLIRDQDQKLLWIHAVSMGETRAVIPLFKCIKEHFPHLAIVISTTTETGQEEAKRSMPEADAHFFLPLDFSWIIGRYIKKLKPSNLILVESDFWYNLLSKAKQSGSSIFLLNGKISERSMRRFQKVPFFTRHLFALFDLMFVQNALYRDRFLSLSIPPSKLLITGNTKLDIPAHRMSALEKEQFREELGIQQKDQVIVIGSSHEPEEEWLLAALDRVFKKFPAVKVLIVPRHPERFPRVAMHLKEREINTLIYSQKEQKRGDERVILIDKMGLLLSCYQIAHIAIVAGSFVAHIGGHNIFEPILYRVPVLFGPHMHSQSELASLVLQAQAGRQVHLQELPDAIFDWLEHPALRQQYSDACHTLTTQAQGATQRTFNHLKSYFS